MIPQTPTWMLREVLGTICDQANGMADDAMGINVQGVKARFAALERSMKVLDVIERDIMKPAQTVIHCAQCEHCKEVKSGQWFYCWKWDMDFRAPDYRAETWFCADGIPRGMGGDSMKKLL